MTKAKAKVKAKVKEQLAVSASLSAPRLVDFCQPLWDTEIWLPGADGLNFFQRPLGTHFLYSSEVKEQSDTNMQVCSQLPCPQAFYLHQIDVMFDPLVPSHAQDALLCSGWVEFNFGMRMIFALPLRALPRYAGARVPTVTNEQFLTWAETYARLTKFARSEQELVSWKKALEYLALDGPVWKLRPHKPGFRDSSGEAFEVGLRWKVAPNVLEPVKITVLLFGNLWLPV